MPNSSMIKLFYNLQKQDDIHFIQLELNSAGNGGYENSQLRKIQKI